MRLYDFKLAPSARRARIAFAEKGLAFEAVDVDLPAGAQLGAPFLKVNPRAVVPVLETDDGELIGENIAIAAYLEALKPEPPLFGSTPLEKARVLEWNAVIEVDLLQAMIEYGRNSHPNFVGRALPGPDGYEQIPALAERGRLRIARFWPRFDAGMAQGPWVAGDALSFADITAIVCTDLAEQFGAGPPAELSNIARWRSEWRRRPSYGA